MADNRVRILIESLYNPSGTEQATAGYKKVAESANQVVVTAEMVYAATNRLSLAQYQAAQAAQTLATAEKNLANNTDPAKQKELEGAVLKARVALDNQNGAANKAARELNHLKDAAKNAGGGQEELTKKTISLKGALGALAAGGVLLSIGSALKEFAVQSISAASQVEEASSKFSFVFGPAAEDTAAALDTFAEAVGRSRYELQNTAAGFGGILEGMLGSKEKAADLSVALTQLSTDLSSFYNVSEGDAAAALTSALVGESEPIRRFGVLLNEAAITSEILSSGMARTKGEITEAMKVQARYNLIMQQTATAQGDAERTSESYANQQRAFQATVQELQVSLGTMLLPTVTELVGIMREVVSSIQPAADAMSGEYGAAVEEMVTETREAAQSQEELIAQSKQLVTSLDLSRTGMGRLTGTTDELERGVQTIVAGFLDFGDASMNLNEINASIEEQLRAVYGETVSVNGSIVSLDGVVIGTTSSLYQLANTLDETAAIEAAFSLEMDRGREAMQQQQEMIQASQQAAAENVTTIDELAQVERELTYTLEENVLAGEAATERLLAYRASFAQLGEYAEAAKQPILDLTAAQYILANTEFYDTETIETAKQTIIDANTQISTSYRTMVAEIVSAQLAQRYGEDALAAQAAALQTQVSLGLITQAQADMMLEVAQKQDLIRQTTEEMTSQYLADGELTIQESQAIANAVGLIENGSLDSASAIQHLAEMGITGLGNLSTSTLGATDQIIELKEEADEFSNNSPYEAEATVETDGREDLRELLNLMDALDGRTARGSAEVTSDSSGVPGGNKAGKAYGGSVWGGQTYQVGEGNKPELFSSDGRLYMIPGDQGRVFSNADSQRMMAGGAMSVSETYVFNIPDQQTAHMVSELVRDKARNEARLAAYRTR